MTLAVCLLLDDAGDRAVRRLWARLEQEGLTTLQTHTHGRHVPHLTLASLLASDAGAVREVLAGLPPAAPTTMHLDALGVFRRSRCWLQPGISSAFVARQEAVATAVGATGAVLHKHYRPGDWLPHLTLAPRLRLDQLPTVARLVFDVLPLTVTFSRAALVETSTGQVDELPHLV